MAPRHRSAQGPERTAEQRERDRAERARLRALRSEGPSTAGGPTAEDAAGDEVGEQAPPAGAEAAPGADAEAAPAADAGAPQRADADAEPGVDVGAEAALEREEAIEREPGSTPGAAPVAAAPQETVELPAAVEPGAGPPRPPFPPPPEPPAGAIVEGESVAEAPAGADSESHVTGAIDPADPDPQVPWSVQAYAAGLPGASAPAGGPAGASAFAQRPRHRRRRGGTRIGAVVALIAVIVAVVLVARSLGGGSSGSAPPAAAKVVKVVIPEGKTRRQIAAIAVQAGLRGSYLVASRRSPLLDPSAFGAPHGTPDLEGFLFPATYDEYPGAPASRLVSDQLVAFREEFSPALTARARALHVTPYQLLIVASMVEREAVIPGDRAKIAAVIYNRLARGMPLGIDASIYYAVELEDHVATYTHELTEAQLHIDSPYNTRTHVGLPPTPISNPGLASIQAAADPAHVSYLYYVAGADGCGEQVFSNTQSAFEANVAAYKAAVARNGGHPPTCKHG